MIAFKKATKAQTRARIALIGTSGSGKTFTALRLAMRLGSRIALIDSERGSASKYAGEDNRDGGHFEFDVLDLETHNPLMYMEAIRVAEAAGYDVVVIDSLSHAWMGKEGALEQVDDAARRSKSGSSFHAWRDVTPQHNRLVDTILAARCHVIVTLRAKTEYAQDKDEKSGKVSVRKLGLAPVMRDGIEYEFDITGDIDVDHHLVIGKTRCSALDGKVYRYPGADLGDQIKAWLTDGAPVVTPPAPAATAAPQAAAAPTAARPAPASKASAEVTAAWATFFATAQVSEFTPAAKDRLAADYNGTVPVEQRRAWYAALETRWLEQLQSLEPNEVPELRDRVAKQFSPNAVPPAITAALDAAAKASTKAPDDDPLPEWAEPKGEPAAAAAGADKAKGKGEKPKRARGSRKAAAGTAS